MIRRVVLTLILVILLAKACIVRDIDIKTDNIQTKNEQNLVSEYKIPTTKTVNGTDFFIHEMRIPHFKSVF